MKPIIILIFFGLFALLLVLTQWQAHQTSQRTLSQAKANIPSANQVESSKITTDTNEQLSLKPIIDLSAWQPPSDIDYDQLSSNISGAIIRVFGGSQIGVDNEATDAKGVDKAFKKHIQEFNKRNIPTAVYAYVQGASEQEMIEEARLFYKNSSPLNPTFYWLDVEEKTMGDMEKGVQAFRKELKRLGAENIGIYIGTYFMEEHSITTSGFDAVWFPTYGSDSGYYEAAPLTMENYHLHQYTSRGRLPGFDQDLDLNQISITQDSQTTYEKLFGDLTDDKLQKAETTTTNN